MTLGVAIPQRFHIEASIAIATAHHLHFIHPHVTNPFHGNEHARPSVSRGAPCLDWLHSKGGGADGDTYASCCI